MVVGLQGVEIEGKKLRGNCNLEKKSLEFWTKALNLRQSVVMLRKH